MKKILVTMAAMMVALGTYAQGTVNFANLVAGSIDAPVFDVGGTVRAAGPDVVAQLYAGPVGGSLTAQGAQVALRTGAGAGYFLGGERVITGVAGGAQAQVQVRAWKLSSGASWEAASVKGQSGTLTLTTGNPGAVPPTTPSDLVGLTSFSLVPEPSTIALGVLGGLALLIRRRK